MSSMVEVYMVVSRGFTNLLMRVHLGVKPSNPGKSFSLTSKSVKLKTEKLITLIVSDETLLSSPA